MVAFHAGDLVGAANPLVTFFYQEKRLISSNGLVSSLFSLSFEVTKDGAPYVVSTVVDVDNDVLYLPGVYFATFATDAMDDLGEYQVTWTYQVTDTSTPATATSKFTLVDPAHPVVDGYAQVSDLIAAGVPVGPGLSEIPVADAAAKLARASKVIEKFCRQKFYPHYEEITLDSRGKSKLLFNEPIIALADLNYTDGDALIDFTDYTFRVYNRHIRQSLVNPDDRNAPRVELLTSQRFAKFQPQQIFVDGYFGYTDPDGTIWGETPDAIKVCAIRLAIRDLAPLYDPITEGASTATSGPVQGEKTYDQSVTYANIIFAREGMGTAYVGYFTGDPRIDQTLFAYKRPVVLGTVS